MSNLKQQMNYYRAGFAPLPVDYIKLHETAARDSLADLCDKHGLRTLATEMTSDGWCDGMRVLRAVCEDRCGKFHDMRWSDSNGGSWFEKYPSGGAGLVWIPDNHPGHM